MYVLKIESPLGSGTHLRLVEPEQEDEQGLREVVRYRRGVRLRGNDSADGETIS